MLGEVLVVAGVMLRETLAAVGVALGEMLSVEEDVTLGETPTTVSVTSGPARVAAGVGLGVDVVHASVITAVISRTVKTINFWATG